MLIVISNKGNQVLTIYSHADSLILDLLCRYMVGVQTESHVRVTGDIEPLLQCLEPRLRPADRPILFRRTKSCVSSLFLVFLAFDACFFVTLAVRFLSLLCTFSLPVHFFHSRCVFFCHSRFAFSVTLAVFITVALAPSVSLIRMSVSLSHSLSQICFLSVSHCLSSRSAEWSVLLVSDCASLLSDCGFINDHSVGSLEGCGRYHLGSLSNTVLATAHYCASGFPDGFPQKSSEARKVRPSDHCQRYE